MKFEIESLLNHVPYTSSGTVFLLSVNKVSNQKMFKNTFKSLEIAKVFLISDGRLLEILTPE